ncbi:MAG: hypothetical protein V7640_1196 [Betaproteobacteria bacterium]
MRSRNNIHTHPRCARFNSETLARVCYGVDIHRAPIASAYPTRPNCASQYRNFSESARAIRAMQCLDQRLKKSKLPRCDKSHARPARQSPIVTRQQSGKPRTGASAQGTTRKPQKETGRKKWITTDKRRMIRTQCPHKPLKPPRVAKWLQAGWESQMYFSRQDHPYL